MNDTLNISTSTQKSRTLPAGTLPSQMHPKSSGSKHHFRSLSESKTSDGITGMVINRTRFNSGDSNVSGISSTESIITGKFCNIRIKLSGFNDGFVGERFRRTSLTGASIRESSLLSEQDVHGYKKLRQIRRNLRPMLSESAADDLADIFENEGNSRTSGRTLISQFALDKRKLNNRNIERQPINFSG